MCVDYDGLAVSFNMPAAHAAYAAHAASSAQPQMKTAKPLLAVITPVGVVCGLMEAWRFHWWLAVLMTAMVSVMGLFTWLTIRRIRAETRSGQRPPQQQHP